MAVPTIVSFTNTYHHPPGTKNWTIAQGAGRAMAGFFWRDSRWVDNDGTWGGLNLSSVQTASGDSNFSMSGLSNRLLDLTGKSGDGRSAYSQWGDEQQYCDFVLAADADISVVQSAKYYWNNAGADTKTFNLDPAGYDCIALIGALIDKNGSGWNAPTNTVGQTMTHHLAANVINGRYCRISSCPWPASAGAGSLQIVQNSQYHDAIVFATLLGVAGAKPKQALFVPT